MTVGSCQEPCYNCSRPGPVQTAEERIAGAQKILEARGDVCNLCQLVLTCLGARIYIYMSTQTHLVCICIYTKVMSGAVLLVRGP